MQGRKTCAKRQEKQAPDRPQLGAGYLASRLSTPNLAFPVPFLDVRELCGSVVGFDFITPVGVHSISAISTFVTLQIVWLSPCATSSPPTFVGGRFLRYYQSWAGITNTPGITLASQSDPLRVSPHSRRYPDWKWATSSRTSENQM
jgi:hypothetical protein